MSEAEKFKEHCDSCKGSKNHIVLKEHEYYEEDAVVWYHAKYQIIQCAGCDDIKFRQWSLFSEDCFGDEEEYKLKLYPSPVKRSLPKWYLDINSFVLRQVMEETYTALQNNSFILAVMGIRTLIDLMIVEKIGDIGSFHEKLGSLVDRNIINTDEKEILNYVIELGNASAHRAYKPDYKAVDHAVDIMEAILERLYVYPKKVDQLKLQSEKFKERIPKRIK